MKTPHLSLTAETGAIITLTPAEKKDYATLEVAQPAGDGKASRGMKVSTDLHRLELHQLYKAMERAWAHMDAGDPLTATTDAANVPAADRVSPNPESVAG